MISILMPIYNGIEFIDESVTSIINQTFTDWELIIGINGHPTGSNVFTSAFKYQTIDKRIRVIDLPDTVKGKSMALNSLISYCSFDWVALLDVDDIWVPTKLESQLPFMNDNDVIGTKCKYFGDRTSIPYIPVGPCSTFNFLSSNPIINSSCLLKKELCNWNTSLLALEDYELWLKLWRNNKKFYNVNSVEVFHRIHSTSAFNTNTELQKKILLMLKHQYS